MITDRWKSGAKPTVSFELFPARDDKAQERLDKAVERLVALKPDFFSVTFGAGGSTREGSLELARRLRVDLGQEVLAYVAGYGLGPGNLRAVVEDYVSVGIDTMLVVRGDPPQDMVGFVPHPESLMHATDMLAYLRAVKGVTFGAAAYPEGHHEAKSREADFDVVRKKVDSGAQFLVTQYCYDNHSFGELVEGCRKRGIDVPIVAGVMPIFNVKMMERLAKLCGATITGEVRAGLEALPAGDKDAVVAFGIDFAVGQCRGLLDCGVAGIHVYTIDRAVSAEGLVWRLREEGLI